MLIKRLADNSSTSSLATAMRRRRFALLLSFLEERRGQPIKLLDVGGTQEFWVLMSGGAPPDVHITLLNLHKPKVSEPSFDAVEGDARDLSRYPDGAFDIVFSNSVIEHLGPAFEDQRRMANEIRRVGKHYFVQTPNRYFPLEPHFLMPVFQFWPVPLRVWAISHFNVGWYKRFVDEEAARREVESISLLSEAQVRSLFPEGRIYREKFLGLTKSFIAYSGWDETDGGQ